MDKKLDDYLGMLSVLYSLYLDGYDKNIDDIKLVEEVVREKIRSFDIDIYNLAEVYDIVERKARKYKNGEFLLSRFISDVNYCLYINPFLSLVEDNEPAILTAYQYDFYNLLKSDEDISYRDKCLFDGGMFIDDRCRFNSRERLLLFGHNKDLIDFVYDKRTKYICDTLLYGCKKNNMRDIKHCLFMLECAFKMVDDNMKNYYSLYLDSFKKKNIIGDEITKMLIKIM